MSDEPFKGISDDEFTESEKKRLAGEYKFIFGATDIGFKVLADILINFCHFGCYLTNPDEVAQHNIGVSILSRLGAFSKGNTEKVVKGLINSLPNKEE